MKIEIKNRWDGNVLWSGDAASLKDGLHIALKSRADLYGANLSRADLYRANLSGANLSGADLYGANLSRADLYRADLYRADLSGANLSGANLSGADLYGADLSRADLSGAENAELVIAKTRILPEGDIIGWKKCKNNILVKLSIPKDAKRSHAFGRKCRAEYVVVLEVIGADKGITDTHGPTTIYRQGEIVKCNKWDNNWMVECSGGIHFFITRLEAENYN